MKYLAKLDTTYLSRTQKALLNNTDPFVKKSKWGTFFKFVWLMLTAAAVFVTYLLLDKR